MKEGNTIHILTFNTADFDEQWSYAFMGSRNLKKLELYKKQLEVESAKTRKKLDEFEKRRNKKTLPLQSKIRHAFRQKATKDPLYNKKEYEKMMKEFIDVNTPYEKECQKILKEFSFGHEHMINDPEHQYLEIDELEMLD